MDCLILSFKRIPKTTLYDSAVVTYPERVILLETSAVPLEAALENLHQLLQGHPACLAGFKKQRAEADLLESVNSAYLLDQETTQKYRQDLSELKKQFAPTEVVIGREG
jgi:hypothetical protein